MRRLLLSFVLLTSIVSICRADYVLIRVMVKPADGGGVGNPPGDGAQPPPPKVDPVKQSVHDYVLALVDAKRAPLLVKDFRKNFPFLETKYGRTLEFYDSNEISMQFIPAKLIKSPAAQYTERRAALGKEKSPSAEKLFELAQWCLQVGLTDRVTEIMAEIEVLLSAKDAPKPTEKLAAALAAYAKIKPILTGDVPGKKKAEQWQARMRYGNIATSRHFAMVNNSEDTVRDGVDRKLAALEGNFKAFYLLFAMKGKALPGPTDKLTAILAPDTGVVRKAMLALETPERLTDGFHGRLENVVIFAPGRLDKAAERFDHEVRAIAQSHANVELLKGQFRPLSKGKEDLAKNNQQVLDDARAQVLMLVATVLRDESELATATHEGSRQLIVETGLLPANLDVPEWLRAGFASLFEMPKGPFPGKNPGTIKMAFWSGVGGPSWAWRRYFDEMTQEGLLPDVPTEALFQTLTGQWAARAKELRAKVPAEGDTTDYDAEADAELARGRTVAWALTYYMFHDRFAEFMTFLDALGNLPRDIELDQYSFLKLFCESFRIDTKGLTPTNLKGNIDATSEFARNMLDSVRRVPLPVVPLKFEEPKSVDPKDPNLPPKLGN